MVDMSLVGMPIFLFLSMVANTAFLVRAFKDVCATNRPIRPPAGPAVAILTCAISELIWCPPPCFALWCHALPHACMPCFASQGGAVLLPVRYGDRRNVAWHGRVVAQKQSWVRRHGLL